MDYFVNLLLGASVWVYVVDSLDVYTRKKLIDFGVTLLNNDFGFCSLR